MDEVLKLLPEGFRFNVGHTPHYYKREELPKNFRKRAYEAYVLTGLIGTKSWIFESADGSTPEAALREAIEKAIHTRDMRHLQRVYDKLMEFIKSYVKKAA